MPLKGLAKSSLIDILQILWKRRPKANVRVLLVEDDRMIGAAVRASLEDADHVVDWLRNGIDAEDGLAEHQYDVVLLDLGLPGQDGTAVLRELRRRGNEVPVIVMTARDGLEDRVLGLDIGADDYMVKPFEMRELLARMRAVTRRHGIGSRLTNGVVELDQTTHEVFAEGAPVQLSPREFSLLEALLVRPGAILSRAQLEARIYGSSEVVESNAVDFLIHGLRKKLGENSIRNVRGVGWTAPREP